MGQREQNCRAGASPADPWNGKRERLPYKSVIRHQRSQVRHGEWSRRDASDIDGQSREAE